MICGIVMLLMVKLSMYKGVPYILLWLIGIVAIYAYITANTQGDLGLAVGKAVTAAFKAPAVHVIPREA